MFQMGGVGPMFGPLGHFHKFAADKITDDYPTNRYRDETKRLLGVLDARLEERDFVMGSGYSIADIAIFPRGLGDRRFLRCGRTCRYQ